MDRAICIGDLVTEEMRRLVGTRCFGSGAIAAGGTNTTAQLAAAVAFCIDGQIYAKAITDDLFVHTDLTVQPINTTRYYLLSLDKTGAALITQGTTVTNAAITAGTDKCVLPKIAATQCAVGVIKISTAAAVFTPATTAMAGGTATFTFYNLSCVPTSGLPA